MSETTYPITAALPLIWNRPRLRFIDGAPDGTSGDQDTSTDETTTDSDVDTENTTDTEDDNPDLGDAGKKALRAMKEQRNAAQKEAREAKAEAARLKAERESAGKPAEEQALETARREGETAATKAANLRIVKAELRSAAKGKLADPADALVFLNLEDFEVGDDGEVDSDALDDAIDELLEKKPHLAAGTPRRFTGTADQGAKEKAAKLPQLTKAQVDAMSPEQINKAREAGQLNTLLGIKP